MSLSFSLAFTATVLLSAAFANIESLKPHLMENIPTIDESLENFNNQICTDLGDEKSELVRMLVVKDKIQYDRLFLYNLIARHNFWVGALEVDMSDNVREIKDVLTESDQPETTTEWIQKRARFILATLKSRNSEPQKDLELYATTAEDLKKGIDKIRECSPGLRFSSRFKNVVKSMHAIFKATDYLTKMQGLEYLRLGIVDYQSVVKKHEELIRDSKSIEDKAFLNRNTIEDLQKVTSEFQIEEQKLSFQTALLKGHMDYTNSAAELGCKNVVIIDTKSSMNENNIFIKNTDDQLRPTDFLDSYSCLKNHFSFINSNRKNYTTTCYPVIDSFFRQQTMCKE